MHDEYDNALHREGRKLSQLMLKPVELHRLPRERAALPVGGKE